LQAFFVGRVRNVERLPAEEERIRSVRPMSESDLLDVLDVSDAPAVAGDGTVPYATPKEVSDGAAGARGVEPPKDSTIPYSNAAQSAEGPSRVRNVVPLRDDTMPYSDRTRGARFSLKI